ncbi:hypothetical protein PMIT1303_00567 [Prochlorococcus sp. MIT 1303]|nr:hypothetical protein PMIT1303_00567 [Prochlorococcus sp. MIT 1303]
MVYLYYLHVCFAPAGMSVVQVKNLQRRLDNLSCEATQELDRACGHELWRNLGFDAFDGLEDAERRARANYYYGQLKTVNELLEALG